MRRVELASGQIRACWVATAAGREGVCYSREAMLLELVRLRSHPGGGKQSLGVVQSSRIQKSGDPDSKFRHFLSYVVKLTSLFWNFSFLKCEDYSPVNLQSSC